MKGVNNCKFVSKILLTFILFIKYIRNNKSFLVFQDEAIIKLVCNIWIKLGRSKHDL